jgi:hypothetical protein
MLLCLRVESSSAVTRGAWSSESEAVSVTQRVNSSACHEIGGLGRDGFARLGKLLPMEPGYGAPLLLATIGPAVLSCGSQTPKLHLHQPRGEDGDGSPPKHKGSYGSRNMLTNSGSSWATRTGLFASVEAKMRGRGESRGRTPDCVAGGWVV